MHKLYLAAACLVLFSVLLPFLSGPFLLAAVLLLLAAAAVFLLFRKTDCGLAVLFLCLFLFRALFLFSRVIVPLSEVTDTLNISGTVCSQETPHGDYSGCCVRLSAADRPGIPTGIKLYLLYPREQSFSYGETVTASCRLSCDAKEQASYFADGVYGSAFCSRIQSTGLSRSAAVLAVRATRRWVRSVLLQNTRNADLLCATVIGERSLLSDELVRRVRSSGVSHVLVVSGLHLSVLTLSFVRITRLFCKSPLLCDGLTFCFLLFFMALCGFTPSVLRCGLIWMLYAVYRNSGRVHDSLLCLCTALCLILFLHPYALYSISLRLSFCATFGILCYAPFFRERFPQSVRTSKILSVPADAAAISFSATLATLPTVVHEFSCLSTYSLPVNILVTPFVTLMLSCCFIGLIALPLPFLGRFFLFCADRLADFFLGTVRLVAGLPGAVLSLRYSLAASLLLLAVNLGFVFYLRVLRPKKTCQSRENLIK